MTEEGKFMQLIEQYLTTRPEGHEALLRYAISYLKDCAERGYCGSALVDRALARIKQADLQTPSAREFLNLYEAHLAHASPRTRNTSV